jgi:hypothetical protein
MSGLESVAKALTFKAERQPHVLTIAGTSTIVGSAEFKEAIQVEVLEYR